ncbi:MAG: BlaI/MecI/CopY family transcriptional regulator [Oscillospiraceae bacterium]
MTERIRTLPDAELAVMQAVWACETPAKRAQIAAILDKTHPMAPTTLLTVLSRLADKGFLRIEKTGRSAGILAAGRAGGLSCPAGSEIL